jgi:hypothetical protein
MQTWQKLSLCAKIQRQTLNSHEDRIMSTVSIVIERTTGQLEATGAEFHAWLHQSQSDPDCYVAHVTVEGEVCNLLRGRIGTLDEWREWIEDALARTPQIA